jgi:3',5'-cyclic AMP phosphodiesterase CpdA
VVVPILRPTVVGGVPNRVVMGRVARTANEVSPLYRQGSATPASPADGGRRTVCGCAWPLTLALFAGACAVEGGVGPSPDVSAVLLVAGDIGQCGSQGAIDTGRLLDGLAGTVAALGDLAYQSGTRDEFSTCYETVWGRHKGRTRPTPGNHEYESPLAQPYFDYFGANAGPQGLGYYSYSAGPWFVLSLNSNVASEAGSEQGEWIRRELEAKNARCSLAYFHHPLVSSGPNGDTPALRGLWEVLSQYGVDVVLNGHEHLYERLAPMTPAGDRDAAHGIRQFTIGTGGAQLSQPVRVHSASERILSRHGVLRLMLLRDGYEWEFLQTDGSRGDAGAGTCH